MLLCRDLEKKDYHAFEVAQLANLCPEDGDEARHLVPSLALPVDQRESLNLAEVDTSQLSEVLQQIAKFKDC